MTSEEKANVKVQLLAFVERVSSQDCIDNRLPEEVNSLPAIVQILLDWF